MTAKDQFIGLRATDKHGDAHDYEMEITEQQAGYLCRLAEIYDRIEINELVCGLDHEKDDQ